MHAEAARLNSVRYFTGHCLQQALVLSSRCQNLLNEVVSVANWAYFFPNHLICDVHWQFEQHVHVG